MRESSNIIIIIIINIIIIIIIIFVVPWFEFWFDFDFENESRWLLSRTALNPAGRCPGARWDKAVRDKFSVLCFMKICHLVLSLQKIHTSAVQQIRIYCIPKADSAIPQTAVTENLEDFCEFRKFWLIGFWWNNEVIWYWKISWH